MSEKHRQILKEDVPELPTTESLSEAQFPQEVIRGESSRNHIHKATLVVLWSIVGAFAMLSVTWLYHQNISSRMALSSGRTDFLFGHNSL